jgi:hypothetical protein
VKNNNGHIPISKDIIEGNPDESYCKIISVHLTKGSKCNIEFLFLWKQHISLEGERKHQQGYPLNSLELQTLSQTKMNIHSIKHCLLKGD